MSSTRFFFGEIGARQMNFHHQGGGGMGYGAEGQKNPDSCLDGPEDEAAAAVPAEDRTSWR